MSRGAAPKIERPDPRQLSLVKDPAPRPFLKWVGGKTQLLEQLQPMLPKAFRRYFEPFVGGAALFFDLRSQGRLESDIVLSDVNAELINCYATIQHNVEALITELRKHRYESDYYYSVREQKRTTLSEIENAARTIFLNKTGYNGLYRVNRSGQFNVPFGKFTNPAICDPDNLRACARALQNVTLTPGEYKSVTRQAKEGDFVYFDPPYVPLSPTSDFTAYVPGGFRKPEQEQLAKEFKKLANRGVHVMLSNSNTELVRDLYADFDITMVYASRSVNSKAAGRGKLPELVVRSWPKKK